MKIGIVGLPNVGKSTLFKALTRNPVDINNYPFCTIEPNVGIVRVPDKRLAKLSEMSKSKKTIPAVIEFVDIAGLVRGASKGEGLGNKFLANIREVDAIVQVVRAFSDPKITHVYNKIDPQGDIETVNTELILADLETAGKTILRLEKEMKGNKKPARNATHSVAGGGAAEQLKIVKEIKSLLEKGKLARDYLEAKPPSDEIVRNTVRELSLLTMKPFIYVYNISGSKKWDMGNEKENVVNLDIKIEEELGEMKPEEAKELGIKSNLDRLILKAYEILGLITFLTTGEDETRAWTVKKGSTAPQAGAAVHTDFQDKFIRADVIFWEKLLEAVSWSRARDLGWLRTEGKKYIVRDGDVIEFKI